MLQFSPVTQTKKYPQLEPDTDPETLVGVILETYKVARMRNNPRIAEVLYACAVTVDRLNKENKKLRSGE